MDKFRGTKLSALEGFHCILSTQEGPWPEANLKSLNRACAHRTFQDRRHSCSERPAKSRRPDGESRPQRCTFHATDSRRGQSIPQTLVPRPNVSVQMLTVQPCMRPMSLHQDPEASRCPAETARGTTNHLHRRHIDLGRFQEGGSGSCNRPGIFTGGASR